MIKFFAVLATVASALMICACASSESKPDYDSTRANAQSAYQELDNDAE